MVSLIIKEGTGTTGAGAEVNGIQIRREVDKDATPGAETKQGFGPPSC
jgi:hypothetical protein